MLVSLGTVSRPCHECDEQVCYLAEKRTNVQMFQKIMQSSPFPSFCQIFCRLSLSCITFELIQIFKLKYDPLRTDPFYRRLLRMFAMEMN